MLEKWIKAEWKYMDHVALQNQVITLVNNHISENYYEQQRQEEQLGVWMQSEYKDRQTHRKVVHVHIESFTSFEVKPHRAEIINTFKSAFYPNSPVDLLVQRNKLEKLAYMTAL